MNTAFLPRLPGRARTQIVCSVVAIPTLTVNVTNTIRLPTPSARAYVLKCSITQSVVGNDADGTLLATLKRRDISAGADVTISSAFNIEGQVANSANERFVLLGESTRLKAREDTLFVDIVSNTAIIDTQPVGFIYVELALLD